MAEKSTTKREAREYMVKYPKRCKVIYKIIPSFKKPISRYSIFGDDIDKDREISIDVKLQPTRGDPTAVEAIVLLNGIEKPVRQVPKAIVAPIPRSPGPYASLAQALP